MAVVGRPAIAGNPSWKVDSETGPASRTATASGRGATQPPPSLAPESPTTRYPAHAKRLSSLASYPPVATSRKRNAVLSTVPPDADTLLHPPSALLYPDPCRRDPRTMDCDHTVSLDSRVWKP